MSWHMISPRNTGHEKGRRQPDLVNINLNDKLRQDLGDMNVGDEKEFSMVVNFLTGYHLAGHPPTGVTG